MALPTNHPFTEAFLTCQSASVGATPVAAVVRVPFRGQLTKFGGVLHAAIVGADCSVAVALNGTAVSGSPFTITQSGSSAGTMGSGTPTAITTVFEDDFLTFTASLSSGSSIPCQFFANVRASGG